MIIGVGLCYKNYVTFLSNLYYNDDITTADDIEAIKEARIEFESSL